MPTIIPRNAVPIMRRFAEGKMLSAAVLAYEAMQNGDAVPGQLLMKYMDQAVKGRAKVLDALPHDTHKCPHSH